MKKLYLIDFDGTISNKDSFILFSFYAIPFFAAMKFWCSTSMNYLLRTKSNAELKEFFYHSNFKNYKVTHFETLCQDFECHKLSKTIKTSFLNYIEQTPPHAEIVVVSASISNYLQPWCDRMKFDLIGTELEVIDGQLTGRFSTPNCNGTEKVKRIKEKYKLSDYDEIHVFGNSAGDFPMLVLGTHRYYQYFK